MCHCYIVYLIESMNSRVIMNAIFYLFGSTIMFFIGFYLGWQKGVAEGKSQGFIEGIKTAMVEVDRLMKGGLRSTLDWETTQRLLKEKMSRN